MNTQRESKRPEDSLSRVFKRILMIACMGRNYSILGKEQCKHIGGKSDQVSHRVSSSAFFHYPARIIHNSWRIKQSIQKILA